MYTWVDDTYGLAPDRFGMLACRPPSATEVERVRLSFHGRNQARDHALFPLGILSGFRISELLSLRVKDVVNHGRVVDYLTVARPHEAQDSLPACWRGIDWTGRAPAGFHARLARWSSAPLFLSSQHCPGKPEHSHMAIGHRL